MKILIVVVILGLLTVVLYRVVKPAINLIRQFRAALTQFQKITTPRKTATAAEKLVRCRMCETWVPESRALTRGSWEYCSRDCLDRAIVTRKNTAA